MKSAQQWFDEYGESHMNPVNKAIHWVCVPAIFFASIGLLWSIPEGFLAGVAPGIPHLHWGTLGFITPLAFYAVLSRPIFIGMVPLCALIGLGCEAVAQNATVAPWVVHTTIFAVAWVFQFIGHKIEGKKPSFFEDLQFLLVGPAWLLHFIYRKVGISY